MATTATFDSPGALGPPVRITVGAAAASGRQCEEGTARRARESRASTALARRELVADVLGEHETDVLVDRAELGDVVGPRSRKKPTSCSTSSSGALAPEVIPTRLDALEPLLAHLEGVVDQVRVGAVLAGDLHQAVGVRRVRRSR